MLEFIIAFIGNAGPKATVVTFLKNEDDISQWTWVSNDIARALRPGMRILASEVSTGKVQTSYEKDGQTLELKTPKVQLFLGGSIEVLPPDNKPVAPATWNLSQVAEYASAYDAKHSGHDDKL